MKRKYLSLSLFFLLAACHKTDAPCSTCNSNCSHHNGDISGNWLLKMSGSYSYPNSPNPNWEISNPNNPVHITFSNDSVFSFNSNYFWKDEHYDRFKIIDSADFIIYSSNPFFNHPVPGKILNSKEIQLTYMGVDAGTVEKYSCY